jgi:hypothetical protein
MKDFIFPNLGFKAGKFVLLIKGSGGGIKGLINLQCSIVL